MLQSKKSIQIKKSLDISQIGLPLKIANKMFKRKFITPKILFLNSVGKTSK
jgi:hypothetical protein